MAGLGIRAGVPSVTEAVVANSNRFGWRILQAKRREDAVDEEGRKRVLVVDDDLDVLRAFMRLLEEYASVKVALGAEAALEHMDKVHTEDGILYDVVVVDFNMNGPNGAWLLKRVRENFQPRTKLRHSFSK